MSIGTTIYRYRYSTPEQILPEWYFLATFGLLRVLSDKLNGIVGQLYFVGYMLLTVPFNESMTNYQNPFNRPLVVCLFLSTSNHSAALCIASICQQPLPSILKQVYRSRVTKARRWIQHRIMKLMPPKDRCSQISQIP